jgi:hypothetical protein
MGLTEVRGSLGRGSRSDCSGFGAEVGAKHAAVGLCFVANPGIELVAIGDYERFALETLSSLHTFLFKFKI